MRKTLQGYSKELSCVSNWSGIKAFVHSFEHASQAFVFKGKSVHIRDTVHAVNYLKSSLVRLELVSYHTVSEYCEMNMLS